MARCIAKNLVAAGVADEMTVQVAYAIGVAKPVSVYVDTAVPGKFEDARIARKISDLFDLRPAKIIEKFGLKNPIYRPTAAYETFRKKTLFANAETRPGRTEVEKTVEFFGWEKLDAVDAVRKAFNL